jgi:4-hydroxy-tetrahydrodipicolinate reductase
MGQALREYLQHSPEIQLAAALEAGDALEVFLASGCQVVVDLSTGPAVDSHGPQVVLAGLGYIVGATGFSPDTLTALEHASQASGSPVLIVPNFSLGANLMIKFAAEAAQLMRSPVITERHHERKADAPSGTALYTAGKLNTALAGAAVAGLPSSSGRFQEQMTGVLGGAEGGVAIHSVRGEGYLAEQAVQLSLPGESLTIEHRSIDRRCFMPGIEYAIRNLHRVQGLQIGLDSIM